MEKLSLEKQLSAVQKELKNDDDNNIPTTSLQQQIEQLSAALQKVISC